MNAPHIEVRSAGQRGGKLCVCFHGTDQYRQQLIRKLRDDFRAPYDRAEKGWILEKRLHTRLYLWCTWSARRIHWTADTPEREEAARLWDEYMAFDRREEQQRQQQQQSRQQQHNPPSSNISDPTERALQLFHLKRSAPLWVAEAVYRAATKRYHPDVGGDHAQMTAITTAIAELRKALRP